MMRTVTLVEPGRFAAGDPSAPVDLGAGEARVRVRRIGVCGTDFHAFRGRQPFFTYPRVLGHELGVEILALGTGAPERLRVGDACAVEPYLNCGHCIACRRGKTNCCVSLQVLGVHVDGGMREEITVPVRKLHPSRTLRLEQLALVEPLSIGAHAVARAGLEPEEWVLVLGAGPIGLSVIEFCRIGGVRVIVADVNPARLAFCRDRLDIAHTLVVGEDTPAQVRALTDGDLPTTVFDATGSPESMARAFDYVASGGRLVFVGLFPGDVTFHDPDFHRRELTLLSTRNATGADFARVIRMMESGELETRPWITHTAALDEVGERFPTWMAPDSGVVKAMIHTEDSTHDPSV